MSGSLDGVRVISVMDREANVFNLFTEQRQTPEVEFPVQARFRLQLPRQSRRIKASKQASRSGGRPGWPRWNSATRP